MTTTNILIYKGTASAALGATGASVGGLAWGAGQRPGWCAAGFPSSRPLHSAAREGRYTAELEQMVDVPTTEKAI